MQTAGLLTSEELRSKAIAISQQRGKSVAQRRIARRWVSWLLWSWVLPIIGLLTVLMAVASASLVYYFGPSTAFDAVQTWVYYHFDIETKTKSVAHQEMKQQDIMNISSTASDLNSSTAINLQIDRNIDIQNSQGQKQSKPASLTDNTRTQLLPKGNQP